VMPIHKISGLNGLVLAGGKSARMQHDKGLIVYHGKPQREFVFDLLSLHCERVYTSCKTTGTIPASLHPLPDSLELDSPLNGILTAFSTSPGKAWLTVPVDMPLIESDTLQYLIQHRDIDKVATCFYDSDGVEPEPLFTLWEPKAYDLLLHFYNNGDVSPKKFLLKHDVKFLRIPNKAAHLNINTQEELTSFLNKRTNPRKE
jgi:molybdenum cofactor guanylyltransferase